MIQKSNEEANKDQATRTSRKRRGRLERLKQELREANDHIRQLQDILDANRCSEVMTSDHVRPKPHRIIDNRSRVKRTEEFLVWWVDTPSEDATWERKEDLPDGDRLVKDYKASQAKKRRAGSKPKKPKRKASEETEYSFLMLGKRQVDKRQGRTADYPFHIDEDQLTNFSQ